MTVSTITSWLKGKSLQLKKTTLFILFVFVFGFIAGWLRNKFGVLADQPDYLFTSILGVFAGAIGALIFIRDNFQS